VLTLKQRPQGANPSFSALFLLKNHPLNRFFLFKFQSHIQCRAFLPKKKKSTKAFRSFVAICKKPECLNSELFF